jgi:hypothetical protein
MRNVTARIAAVTATALAGLVSLPATSNAEPAPPNVRYTLVSAGAADYNINYLVNQPPSKEAYNDDAYAYLKSEQVDLAPGVPWVFETRLEDPQWAIITASTGVHAMTASPNPHCEIAIDGQLAVQQDGPYTAQCQLSNW